HPPCSVIVSSARLNWPHVWWKVSSLAHKSAPLAVIAVLTKQSFCSEPNLQPSIAEFPLDVWMNLRFNTRAATSVVGRMYSGDLQRVSHKFDSPRESSLVHPFAN